MLRTSKKLTYANQQRRMKELLHSKGSWMSQGVILMLQQLLNPFPLQLHPQHPFIQWWATFQFHALPCQSNLHISHLSQISFSREAQLCTNEVQPVGYMTLISSLDEVRTANPHSVLFIIQRTLLFMRLWRSLGVIMKESTWTRKRQSMYKMLLRSTSCNSLFMKTAIYLLLCALNWYNGFNSILWQWRVPQETCHFIWLK